MGFFDLEAAERIGRAASAAGLGVRLHAEQLRRTGAAELGVRLGAASVDHLEQLDADGVSARWPRRDTVATLLPAPAIVLRDRLPPARALIDAGATVALASDANAGTFGGFGAMPLVVGLGATLLGMTVTEALTAATSGGASALRRDDVGHAPTRSGRRSRGVGRGARGCVRPAPRIGPAVPDLDLREEIDLSD